MKLPPLPLLGTPILEEKGKHSLLSNVCSQTADTCERNSDAISTSELSLSEFSGSPGLDKKGRAVNVYEMRSFDSGSPQQCLQAQLNL